MMHNTTGLYDALRSSLAEIDMQIKHVKNDIQREYPEVDKDKLNVWYWLRKPDGSYVLEDLLTARANLIAAMANLKAADMNQKQPRR